MEPPATEGGLPSALSRLFYPLTMSMALVLAWSLDLPGKRPV